MTYKNVWVAMKAILKGKFITVNTYLRREERFQINDLSFNVKHVGKKKKRERKPKQKENGNNKDQGGN